MRVTEVAEAEAKHVKLTDWVQEQWTRILRRAGHIMRRTDGRWTRTVLEWTPLAGHRRVGHQVKRWSDSIVGFLKEYGDKPRLDKNTANTTWAKLAADRNNWESYTKHFAERRW